MMVAVQQGRGIDDEQKFALAGPGRARCPAVELVGGHVESLAQRARPGPSSTGAYDRRVETPRPWTLSDRANRWFDRLLVLALFGLMVLLGWGAIGSVETLLCTLQVVPLWWRRRHPTAVLTAVVLASALQVFLISDPLPSQVVFPIAVYSATRWGGRWMPTVSLTVTVLAAAVASWSWTHEYARHWTDYVGFFVTAAALAVSAWALGLANRQRDQHLVGLVERARQAERMAERDIALAAQDERSRIAREMHDVVAHGLSVMVVQADGARYAAPKDPQVAVEALETIAATGRQSLQEMRRLLGLLRVGDSGVAPQPRLADVPRLVGEAAAAGMQVEADFGEGEGGDSSRLADVGEGVGLAVYRVVQEALTNVRKHAGPDARVKVRVVRTPHHVEFSVTDDGRGAAASPDGAGLGLLGMEERVSVHGGELESGPATGGGWQVQGRIPL